MILGVTGGIACGKSTVVEQLRQLGGVVVSADALAREVVAPGSPVLQALVTHFGVRILRSDGTLDRTALAQLVFADAAARATLNRITHPAIKALAEERLQALSAQGVPLIVYEVPLLFEVGAEKRVDAVLVVSATRAQQLERLRRRDGLDASAAQARIDAQMPLSEKIARADYVIDNSGSEAETMARVEALFNHLCAAGLPPAQQ